MNTDLTFFTIETVEIIQTSPEQLNFSISQALSDQSYFQISQTASEKSDNQILQTVSEKFKLEKSQTLSDQSQKPISQSLTDEFILPGKEIVEKLSFSHITELIKISDPQKRSFYEVECIRGTWSVRELRRQINSLYFERSGLSTDKRTLKTEIDRLVYELYGLIPVCTEVSAGMEEESVG